MTPTAGTALADALILAANLTAGFDLVHVRRTDLVRTCDTSPQSIMRVLRCKFDRGPLNGTIGMLPLVLFSDEANPSYLTELRRALARDFAHVTFGDELARRLRPAADNYIVYSALLVLKVRARFSIKFAGGDVWHVCPSCSTSRP